MQFKTILSILSILIAPSLRAASAPAENIFHRASVRASTEQPQATANEAVDGVISRKSAWISAVGARAPHILEVTLSKYYNLDSVVIYTGIPQQEKNENEKLQAAGFWGMKNFKLQYWDDANWTDIPQTEITENRKDRIALNFAHPITTFRLRLYCIDGEPVRICEFEGYGKENKNMATPITVERTVPQAGARDNVSKAVTARIMPRIVGRTMKYVGYNQGYYMPGSNVSAWIEYSNVNSMRVWANLRDFVPVQYIANSTVGSLSEFEQQKAQLRANPLSNKYITWDSIAAKASQMQVSANSMVLDYALEELKKMNIEVVLQVNDTKFDSTWNNKWQQWQRYYALALYTARKGNVAMFAMQNEPNHVASGPMRLDQWIEAMRIVSNAVHCAVQDANKIDNKQLKARFIGPVTAGTNTNWWATIAQQERVDYRGQRCEKDLIEIFSTHSYNLPAAGYTNKVAGIKKILSDSHPFGADKPVVFTEIGRWMNAYLIDKQETMDSPSLLSEWAGIYTNNMLGGGYGMWAFKFANTVSSTYPRGIKSGHHNIWKGRRVVEDSYPNLALHKPVRAVGNDGHFSAALVTDGNKADSSAWHYSSDQQKWIEIDLISPTAIGGAAIYTGSSQGVFTGVDRIKKLHLEAWINGKWQTIPDTQEEKCKYVQLIYTFKTPIYTSKIRLIIDDNGPVKVREVKLFPPQIADAEPSFDVSSPLRTAQVVRLFAKGFANERPLLETQTQGGDSDLDICCSVDSVSGNKYVWLVQRNLSSYNVSLDLSAIGVQQGARVVCERVDADHYGDAQVVEIGRAGVLNIVANKQSVTLLTITPRAKTHQLAAYTHAVVKAGKSANTKHPSKPLTVELNSGDPSANSVVYLGFDMRKIKITELKRALLSLYATPGDDKGPYRILAYIMGSDSPMQGSEMTWSTAPNLHPSQARMVDVGRDVFVGGEMVFSSSDSHNELDLTEVIKRHAHPYITIALVREVRETGDDYDKDRKLTISSKGQSKQPIFRYW